MILLAVDTSGKHGGVALARVAPDQPNPVLVESVPLAGGTFSAQLVPQISSLLAKHGYDKRDLAGLAVVSGPGSFTGLRVGLAAVKALAEVLQKPIAAVSLLEAVAQCASARGSVVAALDAGRQEIYAGEYEISGDDSGASASVRSDRLLTRDEFLGEARGKLVVTPDASVAELAQGAGIKVEHIAYPGGAAIAGLGWQKICHGLTVSPEQLEANYVRRSDAEIFSQPKP